MMRLAFAVLLGMGTLWVPQTHAQPPSPERVRWMLSGYEQVPDAAAWRALGPEALATLVALYDDPDQPPYVRLRAVGAAAHYPSQAARTFLLAVARAPGQSDLFVRQAVLALGRAFGPRAIADVAPFLDSPEPVVREAAGRALARIGDARSIDVLRSRLEIEPNATVRRTLERSLRNARP